MGGVSNADLARRLVASLRESGVDGVAGLLDEQVRMVLPFAPEGTPREVNGKAAVLEALRFVPTHFARFRMIAHECYECRDRGTVILECTSLGLYRSPEAPAYQNRYVILFTFRNGLVTQWCEYFNPYPVLWSAAYLR
jgi:ketosteroid isomerase-like protein